MPMPGVVTAQARSAGWNVNIASGAENRRIAGVFHPPGSNSLTYRDILDEVRLCFEFRDARGNHNDGAGLWTDIALAHEGFAGEHAPPGIGSQETEATRTLIILMNLSPHADCHAQDFDYASFGIESVGWGRLLLRTIYVITNEHSWLCSTTPAPFTPSRPSLLAANKPSNDPRVAGLPYRQTLRPSTRRGSQSPRKRSASGSMSRSVSPTKDTPSHNVPTESGGVVENVTEIAPPTLDIPADKARQIMSSFRSACLVQDNACAVTKKGHSWFNSPVGPAVQACHIVPQHHYHVYPVSDSFGEKFDAERLREAWHRTWQAENGILLLSHLHELFDGRLFSIHPTTLRVRVFVPYDVLLEYHGKLAVLNEDVDLQALRHHYDMCCLENMAAKMNPSEIVSEPASLLPSGSISPLRSASHTPVAGDPVKSAREGPSAVMTPAEIRHDPRNEQDRDIEDDPDGGATRSTQGPALTHGSSAGSIADDPLFPAHIGPESHSLKRPWLDHDVGDSEPRANRQVGSDAFDARYITPRNSQKFLQHVNDELLQRQAEQGQMSDDHMRNGLCGSGSLRHE